MNLVIGKEKHVVSELPQQLSVNRGNGKIDMVSLIDGLHSARACWSQLPHEVKAKSGKTRCEGHVHVCVDIITSDLII